MSELGNINQVRRAENGLNELRRAMDLEHFIKALRREYGFSGSNNLAAVTRHLSEDLIAWAEAELAKLNEAR